MTKTNETTLEILDFLFHIGIFAKRNSVGAVNTSHGFYSMGMAGSADIYACVPPTGQSLWIEIKTGKDRQSLIQVGFQKNIERMGGKYLVVKDFDDFLLKFSEISYPQSKPV